MSSPSSSLPTRTTAAGLAGGEYHRPRHHRRWIHLLRGCVLRLGSSASMYVMWFRGGERRGDAAGKRDGTPLCIVQRLMGTVIRHCKVDLQGMVRKCIMLGSVLYHVRPTMDCFGLTDEGFGSLTIFAQNDRLPAVQEYCGLHSSVIPGGQFQMHSPFYDFPKDVDLNNGPQDANTTLGQASESTPMEISWVRNKLLNMRKEVSMKKSQVASSCANVHSQILPGSMAYSESSRRIFGCTVSVATKRDSEPSSTVHMGTDITALIKGIANMQIQSQKKKDDTNGRDLMDLNVALPFMDDMEMDVHQSEGNNSVPQKPNARCIDLNVALPFMTDMEIDTRQSGGDTVPQAPDDPSNEALAITAAENLIAMHNDEFQARSPHVNDILHWFADLTISAGENMVVYNTESNNGDGSEALKLQLFETKDSVYSSALYTQDRKSNEDHVSAAAPTFKASDKANSSTETPSEDGHPEDIITVVP